MKLLAVVQRYGPDIGGGAEQLVHQTAQRLAARGHRVEILTSCASSYLDWATHFAPGVSHDEGVVVNRLVARHTRDGYLFNGLHDRASTPAEGTRMAMLLSEQWIDRVGPVLVGYRRWLRENMFRFDAIWFSGYMYTPTTRGLPFVAPFRPTIFQSVAHDEAALRMPSVAPSFHHAAGFGFLTVEERDLVERRFRPMGVKRVVGAGITVPDAALVPRAATPWLGDRPYVICVGRIDPGKGTLELAAMFAEYKRQHPGPLALLLVGESVHPIEVHPDIAVTGFVSELTKWSLLDGAEVLVQPSFHESFSLSLAEGWSRSVPALVQRSCAVLAGQVERSGGGLCYSNYTEFDAALGLLLEDHGLASAMGRAGHDYAQRYEWPTILDRFEELIDASIDHHGRTTTSHVDDEHALSTGGIR